MEDVYNTNQKLKKVKNIQKEIELASIYKFYKSWTTSRHSQNKSKLNSYRYKI